MQRFPKGSRAAPEGCCQAGRGIIGYLWSPRRTAAARKNRTVHHPRAAGARQGRVGKSVLDAALFGTGTDFAMHSRQMRLDGWGWWDVVVLTRGNYQTAQDAAVPGQMTR